MIQVIERARKRMRATLARRVRRLLEIPVPAQDAPKGPFVQAPNA